MNTREDLSIELYGLSGWEENTLDWHGENKTYLAPKYTLGFLLRQLPYDEIYRTDMARFQGKWTAYLWGPSPFATLGSKNYIVIARGVEESPEDAACKLAIELFGKNILKRTI